MPWIYQERRLLSQGNIFSQQHENYTIINHSESEKSLACNVIGFKNYRISYDFEYERYFQNYEGQ